MQRGVVNDEGNSRYFRFYWGHILSISRDGWNGLQGLCFWPVVMPGTRPVNPSPTGRWPEAPRVPAPGRTPTTGRQQKPLSASLLMYLALGAR